MQRDELEKVVLDDGTIGEMAGLWFDENVDVFDEAGVDLEQGWTEEPPEELDQIAYDAAADILDQLRNPGDGSAGIIALNTAEDVADVLYFAFAEITAASPEDYEAWYAALEEDEGEGDEGEEPGDEGLDVEYEA